MVTHTVVGRTAPAIRRGFALFAKEHFKNRTDLVGAEIGVWRGENAEVLKQCLSPKLLVLVDIWEDFGTEECIYEQADNYLETYYLHRGDPSVLIIKADSVQAAEALVLKFDFVYIDGNHTYSMVKRDIEAWYPKVKSGGVFGGHDYNMLGVKQAINETIDGGVSCDDKSQGQDWWTIKL